MKKFVLVGEWEHKTGAPISGKFTDEESAKKYADALNVTYEEIEEDHDIFDDMILY